MTTTDLIYRDGNVSLFRGDSVGKAVDLWAHPLPGDCVVIDPPWDQPELMDAAAEHLDYSREVTLLVFTDARRFAGPLDLFGAPRC